MVHLTIVNLKRSTRLLEYYPFLDGFRALAIGWVIIHHINYFFNLSPIFPSFIFDKFNHFAKVGVVGVDLFFVTSGFLISGLIFEDLDSKIRVKRFYLRRVFKILPQYILVVIAGIAFTLTLGSIQGIKIISYIFLFQNYIHPIASLGHLWSIAVEEHFYLIYPLMIQWVCVSNRSHKKRKIILLSIFLILMVAIFFIRRYTFMAYPYNQLLLFQMSHLRFDALFMGCLIKLMEPFLKSLRYRFLPLVFFLFSGIFFYKYYVGYDPCRSFTYVWAYLASGFLLVSALCGFKPLIWATQNSFMRYIGRCSYAVYLWHFLILFILRQYLKHPVGMLGFIVIFISVMMAGILSTMTIEKYFLNLRKKWVP